MMVEAVTLVVVGGEVDIQSVIVVAIGWVAEVAVGMANV